MLECVQASETLTIDYQDIPIPSILSIPRWWGSAICCADAENYNILGLDQLSFLPVMPLPGMTSPGVPPRIITSGDGGFVVLQASGEGSIAVFLTANGDPGGALIEMPRFPLDIGTLTQTISQGN